MKYRRHYYLSIESPLARDSTKEQSNTSNGLGGISLCSSRSRAHRNSGSFGKNSRKNSQETEGASPRRKKEGVVDKVGDESQRDSLTEDGNIVLDPTSILDEIMAQPFLDSGDEKSPPRGLLNGTASPSRELFSRDKDSKPEANEKKVKEEVTSRVRSAAMDMASSPQLKSKAKLVSQRTSQESNGLPESSEDTPSNPVLNKARSVDRKQELRRAGSISKEDHRKSGGSWNQLSGGKALGMFYHNRRSHLVEEGQEEHPLAENGPSDNVHPISPLAETTVKITFDDKEPASNTAESETEVRVL